MAKSSSDETKSRETVARVVIGREVAAFFKSAGHGSPAPALSFLPDTERPGLVPYPPTPPKNQVKELRT